MNLPNRNGGSSPSGFYSILRDVIVVSAIRTARVIVERSIVVWCVLAAAALCVGASASGEPATQPCHPIWDLLVDTPAHLLAVRAGVQRAYFVADGPGCPAATARCRSRSYLVSGDRVLATHEAGAYACAAFLNGPSSQSVTEGWLPRALLVQASSSPSPRAAWLGDWSTATWGNEQELDIHAATGGALAITGIATWGGDDPARVASGGVNVGTFTARFVADERDVVLTPSDTPGCSVRLWLFRHVLAAEDNGQCGGLNVTFSGFYTRTPRR